MKPSIEPKEEREHLCGSFGMCGAPRFTQGCALDLKVSVRVCGVYKGTCLAEHLLEQPCMSAY